MLEVRRTTTSRMRLRVHVRLHVHVRVHVQVPVHVRAFFIVRPVLCYAIQC